MLQHDRNRTPLSRLGWSAAALAVAAVSLPLAAAGLAPRDDATPASTVVGDATPGAPAVREDPQTLESTVRLPSGRAAAGASAFEIPRLATTQPIARLAGRVLDQTGGAVPGASVTLTEIATGVQAVHQTDAVGRFLFRELQPAEYELVVSLPGFTTVRNVITLARQVDVQRTITLPIGTVSETVTVACQATAIAGDGGALLRVRRFARHLAAGIFPVVAAQQPPAAPVRVGGNIRPPRKLIHVNPVCPPTVPAHETTVRLTGRIGIDGFLDDLAPTPPESGAEPPIELIEATLAAVRQWTFTPTLLNGVPVEVNITVRVVFTRM